MDKNEFTKTELWTKRIQDFHESGLSRKEWCREHQVPLSTLSYWIRKQTVESAAPKQIIDPVLPGFLLNRKYPLTYYQNMHL